MKLTIETDLYNERRYSKPYVGVVSSLDGNVVRWGTWIGTPGSVGMLEIEVEPGEIVMHGQKDNRGINGAPRYAIVSDEGALEYMGKAAAVNKARAIEKARAALASTAQPPITYAPPAPTLGVAPFGPGTSAALAAAPKAAPVESSTIGDTLAIKAFQRFGVGPHTVTPYLNIDKPEGIQGYRFLCDALAMAFEAGRALHGQAPAPAPAAQGDALDAQRYRELRRGQRWSVVDGIGDTLRGDALDAAIDADSAAKEGN